MRNTLKNNIYGQLSCNGYPVAPFLYFLNIF